MSSFTDAISVPERVLVYKTKTLGSEWILGPDETECLPNDHYIRHIFAYIESGTPYIKIGSSEGTQEMVSPQTILAGWEQLAFIHKERI